MKATLNSPKCEKPQTIPYSAVKSLKPGLYRDLDDKDNYAPTRRFLVAGHVSRPEIAVLVFNDPERADKVGCCNPDFCGRFVLADDSVTICND